MQILSLLLAVLVRTVAITVFYVAVVALVSVSDDTDPLGAGLLFFLALVVLALGWATYDGVRRGVLAAAVIWVLTGAAVGVTVAIAFVLQDGAANDLGEELSSSWLFFALLVALPALVGSVAGGLAGRGKRQSVHA